VALGSKGNVHVGTGERYGTTTTRGVGVASAQAPSSRVASRKQQASLFIRIPSTTRDSLARLRAIVLREYAIFVTRHARESYLLVTISVPGRGAVLATGQTVRDEIAVSV
jgi:hypothetical protein